VAVGSVNLFYDWNWEAAGQSARRALELSPNSASAHLLYSNYSVFLASFEGAIREAQEAEQLEVAKAQRAQGYVDAFWIAVPYAALGEADDALGWLTKAYEERSASMVQLNTNPALDPLRDDARFRDLVRRMKFPN